MVTPIRASGGRRVDAGQIEAHPNFSAAAGARDDGQFIRDLRDQAKPQTQAGALTARLEPASVVGDQQPQLVLGQRRRHLDVAALGVVSVQNGVGERLGRGQPYGLDLAGRGPGLQGEFAQGLASGGHRSGSAA